MTTHVEVEDIEATKSEKFLAVVLAAFLLIGSVWFYVKTDDWVRDVVALPKMTAAHTAAEKRAKVAARNSLDRSSQAEIARRDWEAAREAYRTELDAGKSAPQLEAQYRAAGLRLKAAERAERSAARESREADVAAKPLRRDYAKKADRVEVKRAWLTAILRFVFIFGWFAVSLRIVSTQRRRRSRFLPLGFAATGTGVVTALVYATDYITDYIDPLDLGPIVLSAAGAAATIGAFVGLQRWLSGRIPGRRVRNGECPFCGHPVRGDARHCEGCGREVVAPCGSCGEPRRVGSAHCSACGAGVI